MFLYIKKEEGSSLEVQWLRLHGSNAGGQGAGGRREREKKNIAIKKKKVPSGHRDNLLRIVSLGQPRECC